MAQLIFSTMGETLGSRLPGVWGQIGSVLGQAAGSVAGRSIDQQIFGPRYRREGARLTDLHLQASTEGASIPAIYGSVRIAGQVIWAARFKERTETEESGGGKGGGPSVTSTSYRYTLSFAVGLCEGRVARIGRVWANGEAFDLSQVAWRLHDGSETQEPDPLIETIEGAENAPAYRGLAYVVFEDLPLERFGNAIPQFSFEIICPAPSVSPRFEERVKGLCLIPGAGEFVYATDPIFRRLGPGHEAPENVHAERERANLLVALDQLQADFPNCEHVLLVVAWFGDDLRCGECTIRPRVEVADKETTPVSWSVGGTTRGGAQVVSLHDGAPAYGGTPSDASVRQAIATLKARGFKVGLYPFLLMDVPADNGLPDPYGAAEQAPYPWRGRITLHPAAGEPGSPDKTAAATAQVDAFFGEASHDDFSVAGSAPAYAGPDEWSYRRFVLHYAKLAGIAGGVDTFIIGSELRGITTARDGAASYPAVDALRDLAAEVRTLVGPETTLTYAADWSCYFGHQPQDGSGDVFFHLDPLWSDANIDVVGVDWYAPLTDWRDGATHLDAQLARNIHDADYLEGRIEAGEGYDWFYASGVDRAAQLRTPITDGAYAEPWIYRAKDMRNFWARAHHNRPGGVRDALPTPWAPQSKPIWLIELGCPAVDKGANAPNLFIDDKSSESALPPFSDGARDDLIQRRVTDAYLRYWDADGDNNPASTLNGKPMIEAAFAWCFDARPYPAFPARHDVWADGGSWRRGHWLNGRAGLSSLGEVVTDLCLRAGVDDVDASALLGAVSGYVVDSPGDARGALEPLMAAYDFIVAERDGQLVFFHRAKQEPTDIAASDLGEHSVAERFAQRGDSSETPIEARVRFLDAAKDYLIAGVSARRLDRAEGGVVSIDAPLVLELQAAERMAQALLADARAAAETLQLELGPVHTRFEPGDRITLSGGADIFEIARVEDAELRRLDLKRMRPLVGANLALAEPTAPSPPSPAPTPGVSILDLPLLPSDEADERPLAAVFASPWLGAHDIYAGASLTRRARATQPAIMGELLWALWPGPLDRWDDGNVIRIKLYGGALSSVAKDALLDGANAFAIEGGDNWEVVQVRHCTLVGPNEYELRGFLRGQLGSAHAMRAPHPVGARIVKLDDRLTRVDVAAHEWREVVSFVTPPSGAVSSDPRAAGVSVMLPHAARRAWAPAHVRAYRASDGDIAISWIRCARSGDTWGAAEPPIGAPAESYRLDILDGETVKRSVTLSSPNHTYATAEQLADFGAPPVSLRLRVAQMGPDSAAGLNKELTIAL